MKSIRGFTLIEVVVVIVLGGILTSIAMNAFGGAQSRFAVRSARSTFAALHARTRAYAVERGTRATLTVDLAQDIVTVESGGTQVDIVNFGEQMNVDIQSAATGPIVLCMTPRGYADTACGSFSAKTTVTFVQGPDQTSLDIWPLGQLEY